MSQRPVLFVKPEGIRLAVSPRGNVGVRFDLPKDVESAFDEVGLAAELTPNEARLLARNLENVARQAEAAPKSN